MSADRKLVMAAVRRLDRILAGTRRRISARFRRTWEQVRRDITTGLRRIEYPDADVEGIAIGIAETVNKTLGENLDYIYKDSSHAGQRQVDAAILDYTTIINNQLPKVLPRKIQIIGDAFQPPTRNQIKHVKDKVDSSQAQLFSQLSKSSAQRVKDVIIKAATKVTGGKGARDIGRDIVRAVQGEVNISQAKAQRIARTEIIRAHWDAERELSRPLKNEGVVTWIWDTSGDPRVCQECRDKEGMEVTSDDIYDHPNGRCTLLPNVNEDAAVDYILKAMEE